MDRPEPYPYRSHRRSAGGAGTPCHDAYVVATEGTGSGMKLVCKRVDKDRIPVGEPFDVHIYKWECDTWDEADPPIASGDFVPIQRVMPTQAWMLILRIVGTCPYA